jgi:hypothetical protein
MQVATLTSAVQLEQEQQFLIAKKLQVSASLCVCASLLALLIVLGATSRQQRNTPADYA